jgi:hypothetical protein
VGPEDPENQGQMGAPSGSFELNIGSAPSGNLGGDGFDEPMVEDAEPVIPVWEEDEFFTEREREEFKAQPSYFLLLGRQGVGKSSFINMMAKHQKAPARKGTENTTTTMRPYQLSKSVGLVFPESLKFARSMCQGLGSRTTGQLSYGKPYRRSLSISRSMGLSF